MPTSSKSPSRRGRLVAHHWLFPLALGYGLAVLPLWLVAYQRGALTSTWHGHEMLFGYALLVVAGFLVTRVTSLALVLLVLTWAAARIAAFFPETALAVAAGLSFPTLTVWLAARPLWRGAKRHENRIVPLVLLALALLDAAWWLGGYFGSTLSQHRALIGTIDLLALLMLIVGGRVVPATVGGFLERHGIPRRDAVRRGYELPLAAVMALMLAADLAGWTRLAGLCAGLAATVTLVRLARWQLHHTARQTQLWTLALAYLWLVAALALKAAAQLFALMPLNHAIHGLTVGALGSLTLVMMTRTALLQRHLPLARFADIGLALVLMSTATVLRLWDPIRPLTWWAAAVAWSLALAIGLSRLLRMRR